MLRSILKRDSATSHLFDSNTFYEAFKKDLLRCKQEAIIESPYITLRRLEGLMPAMQKAIECGVALTVNTKPPHENDNYMRLEAERGIIQLQKLGVKVLYTGGHHRKLAIFDRKILWEGSLNILSQSDSCEIMKRTNSEACAKQLISFIKIDRYLK